MSKRISLLLVIAAVLLLAQVGVRRAVVDAQTGAVSGQSLNIAAPDGSSLKFENGVLTVTNAAHNGGLYYYGNEITVWGWDDPPKVRLASNFGGGGVSFNNLTDITKPWQQRELNLLIGSADEESPATAGGQLRLYTHMRNVANDDAAMRLMMVSTTAYPQNTLGLPELWLSPYTHADSLGRLAQGPPPPMDSTGGGSGGGSTGAIYPTAIASSINLSGAVGALVPGDGTWLTAVQSCCDTEVVANLDASGQTSLDVEVRSSTTSGTMPYAYVWVNGASVVAAAQVPATTAGTVLHVALATPISGATTVKVRGSAQTGTLEVGGIRAQ